MVAVMDPHGSDQMVACTLGSDDAGARLAEWASLRGLFRRGAITADGAQLWFDSAAAGPLHALAAKEVACCAFLRLEVGGDGDLTRLRITSDHVDARPVIALLAAQASGQSLE
jgi:hypothetical protein